MRISLVALCVGLTPGHTPDVTFLTTFHIATLRNNLCKRSLRNGQFRNFLRIYNVKCYVTNFIMLCFPKFDSKMNYAFSFFNTIF